MTILWKLAQCADHLTRCHPERSEGPFLGCGHRLLRGAVPGRYTRTCHEVPRTAASAHPRTIVDPSLAGGRRHLCRRVHRAARCQHRAARAAGAGAGLRRAGRFRALGRHRLSAGLCLQPRRVGTRLGDDGTEAALPAGLRAVHAGLAAVRSGRDAGAARGAAGAAGRGRRAPRRQQHDHPGELGARGQAAACDWLVHHGASGGRQPGADRRRPAARRAGLALDLLGGGAVRPARLRDGLASPAALARGFAQERRDLRRRGRGCCWCRHWGWACWR